MPKHSKPFNFLRSLFPEAEVTGSYDEHGNERVGSINDGKFLQF
jgi:hypothetical protein